MPLWEYCTDDYANTHSISHAPVIHPTPADITSESWCSVQYPTTPARQAIPLSTAQTQQRVIHWLETYHVTSPLYSVRYEAISRNSNNSCSGGGVVIGNKRRLSEISLVDFLKCSAPYRPSFLDRSQRNYEQSEQKPQQQHHNLNEWCTAHTESPVLNSSRQSLNANGFRCAHVGGGVWRPMSLSNTSSAAATSLEDTQSTALGGLTKSTRSTAKLGMSSASANEVSSGIGSSGSSSSSTNDNDAEFLGHVFQHFVAFQPLDFAPHTPVARSIADDTLYASSDIEDVDCNAPEGASSIKKSSLWSYFSEMFEDFTRDVTFIH
ncbi:hypothetical protein BX661DRAFT_195740 [Kickxella alabastrina]|uniref:uncharacterized protein n=1 Tax=Kickxella alabastrina TaxID=61397 RepID=UPI00221F529D|nr:uncharacterized protein BX661DRAFT_195740 [Kickxella alabastrina]KAI7835213.1 hypothetical protein BX661DRAFT_195740 [Kickxella alabastrina]